MGGWLVSYMGVWYYVIKYVVEVFSDVLWMEIKDFGIKVVIIEFGGIKINWGFIVVDYLEVLVCYSVY